MGTITIFIVWWIYKEGDDPELESFTDMEAAKDRWKKLMEKGYRCGLHEFFIRSNQFI